MFNSPFVSAARGEAVRNSRVITGGGLEKPPALVVEYTDPMEGFQGWLVIDALDHNLCAGGMRVQPGLTRDRLAGMARNMTRKMRICGLRVDGAKSGIDYDPASPGKPAAISRFMAAIRPYIASRYSMGPDLNVHGRTGNHRRVSACPRSKWRSPGPREWNMAYFRSGTGSSARKLTAGPSGKLRAGYGVAAWPPCHARSSGHSLPTRHRWPFRVSGPWPGPRSSSFTGRESGSWRWRTGKNVSSENGAGLDMQRLLETSGPLLPETGFGA
jgi:hypothetical protein